MVTVVLKKGEPWDAGVRRFKRISEKLGMQREARNRKYYEKPSKKRKREKAAAIKRHLKQKARDKQEYFSGGRAGSRDRRH